MVGMCLCVCVVRANSCWCHSIQNGIAEQYSDVIALQCLSRRETLPPIDSLADGGDVTHSNKQAHRGASINIQEIPFNIGVWWGFLIQTRFSGTEWIFHTYTKLHQLCILRSRRTWYAARHWFQSHRTLTYIHSHHRRQDKANDRMGKKGPSQCWQRVRLRAS